MPPTFAPRRSLFFPSQSTPFSRNENCWFPKIPPALPCRKSRPSHSLTYLPLCVQHCNSYSREYSFICRRLDCPACAPSNSNLRQPGACAIYYLAIAYRAPKISRLTIIRRTTCNLQHLDARHSQARVHRLCHLISLAFALALANPYHSASRERALRHCCKHELLRILSTLKIVGLLSRIRFNLS